MIHSQLGNSPDFPRTELQDFSRGVLSWVCREPCCALFRCRRNARQPGATLSLITKDAQVERLHFELIDWNAFFRLRLESLAAASNNSCARESDLFIFSFVSRSTTLKIENPRNSRQSRSFEISNQFSYDNQLGCIFSSDVTDWVVLLKKNWMHL